MTEETRGDRPTVLVVDDDEAVRSSLHKTLRSRCSVHLAPDGATALRLLEEEGMRPDLILLDVRMPGPDGYEVCRTLQDHDELALIPVVFVTVLDTDRDRRRAFESGGVGFLGKPFETQELWNAVEEALRKSWRWRELEEDRPDPASPVDADADETLWDRVAPARFQDFRDELAAAADLDGESAGEIDGLGPEDFLQLPKKLGMSEERVSRHLAEFLDLRFMPRILADDVALGALPRAFCQNHLVIPLEDGSAVAANPFDPHLLDALRRSLWKDEEPALAVAPPGRVAEVFQRRGPSSTSDTRGRVMRLEHPEEADATPAHQRASEVLRSAVVEGASDVHLEPKENQTVIRFRIDGEMEDVRTVTGEDSARIISRLKALADMDIAERRKPQDGAVRAALGDRQFKLRLATSSTPHGESLVIRILEPDADPVPLDQLGMTEDQAEVLHETANRSQGMILVVGPTGSGKSTTVFTLLSTTDIRSRSLLSVEDPIEYNIADAKQQEVNEVAGLTFESLLRSAMRQDPDILLLGEVRDGFSANAVLDFASSGHLTVSTLHSANATTAVFRLERLGVERGAMADALSVVVAQKLLRVLCAECRTVADISGEERELLANFTDDVPEEVARPAGCPACRGTGYQGRTGLFELLKIDAEVGAMIREGRAIGEIRTFCQERGDLLLEDHAVMKIRDLLVPVSDAREVVLLEALERRASSDGGERAPEAARETGASEEMGASEKTGASEETQAPEDTEAAREAEEDGAGEARILVVEDEPTTRTLIRTYLEESGFEVDTATDGVGALMHLGSERFDAVVSDLEMPNMDGETLLEMMTEKGLEVPILFVTGSHDEDTEAKLLRKGAVDFVTKPVQGDVLVQRLEIALGR